MDDRRFDNLLRTLGRRAPDIGRALPFARLPRRLVLGGLAGGSLAALLGATGAKGKKVSRAQRCRRSGGTVCAGGCCPRGRSCENGACIAACVDPLKCPDDEGRSCGANGACLCTETATGDAACLDVYSGGFCSELTACSGSGDCPAGKVCATCVCDPAADLRCIPPCADLTPDCRGNGRPCQGGSQCCSGVCGGRRGLRTCRAAPGQGICTIRDVASDGTLSTRCDDDSGAACFCYLTSRDTALCGEYPGACSACSGDADCGPEERCIRSPECVGSRACVRACPSPA